MAVRSKGVTKLPGAPNNAGKQRAAEIAAEEAKYKGTSKGTPLSPTRNIPVPNPTTAIFPLPPSFFDCDTRGAGITISKPSAR
jgi:hypothetical protein